MIEKTNGQAHKYTEQKDKKTETPNRYLLFKEIRLLKNMGQGIMYGTYSLQKNNTTGHPAVFPEQLAKDHILTWSNESDIVLDPFMESGTTALACIKNNRNLIGFEISEEYCRIANERIDNLVKEMVGDAE